MTMEFFMTPGTCSTGIHILLEELGLVFEVHLVNLIAGDQHSSEVAHHEAIKAQGKTIIEKGFKIADGWLQERDYIARDFSIADAALFYVEFWADRIDIPLPENCLAHYERMLGRQTVRQVLMEEGYASVYRLRESG
jgi:glutathione S-transferase